MAVIQDQLWLRIDVIDDTSDVHHVRDSTSFRVSDVNLPGWNWWREKKVQG